MGRQRLEAFSDGVFAILITIMVLDLKIPQGEGWSDLLTLMPRFYTYALSFVFVGIYWNNHHHLIHTVERTTGGILWANLLLLFWISLFPFGCAWVDESYFAALPTAVYSFILMMAGFSYYVLLRIIIATHGRRSTLARAIKIPLKEKLSIGLYLLAIGIAFVKPLISQIILLIVAGMWLIPDRRIERAMDHEHD